MWLTRTQFLKPQITETTIKRETKTSKKLKDDKITTQKYFSFCYQLTDLVWIMLLLSILNFGECISEERE